jgi:hypothetical protein
MFEYLIIGMGLTMLLISFVDLYNMIRNNDPELDNYFDED